MIALADGPIDPAGLLQDFLARTSGAGAVVSFTGLVRGAHDGEPVEQLWLDHHEVLTLASVDEIAATAKARFALTDIAIVHRVGALAPGDPILFVAATAAHRRAAFDAVDYAMDRLKTDAILWKREQRSGRVEWIEARGGDHAARARWEGTDNE